MSRFLTERSGWVLALLVLVGVGSAAYAATELRPTVATDQFVNRSSAVYQANERVQQAFGEDAVTVLVKGKLTDTMLSADLGQLIGIEGCISGNAPRGAEIPGGRSGPCGQLAAKKPVAAVYGPGTFVNEAVRQIGTTFQERQKKTNKEARSAAEAARKLAQAQGKSPAEQARLAKAASDLVQVKFLRDLVALSQRYGLTTVPHVNDPRFVADLIFNSRARFGTPKAKFAYLFPNANSALIQVRLKPDLNSKERDLAIKQIERATEMSRWRLAKGKYVVAGVPTALERLSTELTNSLAKLLAIAFIVMACVLLLVFRQRPRALPLLLSLIATAILAAILSLLGISVTVASIAALPIMLGLAIDYSVQFQARIKEEISRGEAIESAARISAAPVLVAAGATLASFLALLISPVPLMRGFAISLIFGIVIAVVVGFAGTVAGLSLAADRQRSSRSLWPVSLLAAARGAVGLLKDGARWTVNRVTARPRAFLLVAVVLAAAGWAVETQSEIETDVFQLLPSNQPGLSAANELRATTGLGGTVQVLIEGKALTSPKTVKWIQQFKKRALARYDGRNGLCGKGELCVGLSYADLVPAGGKFTQAEIERTIDAVPSYYTAGVINHDRDMALLSFGIRAMSAAKQEQVISWLRDNAKAPTGINVTVTGLPAILADANAGLTDPLMRFGTLVLALLAILLVLRIVLKQRRRVLIPILPIALASGWTALLLWLFNVSLNPLSASVGALVIAISTEFSIIVSERYWRERESGLDVTQALTETYRSTGKAVLASALTATIGFAVLLTSEIPLLRDFGVATVVGLVLSALGVALVLPATFILLERGTKKS